MRHLTLLLLLWASLLFSSTTIVTAQTYDLSWHTIAGGGGTSTGGAYTVSGTIGQADAGNLAGGAYSLTGGFWGVITTIQTPGAPLLSILSASANHVVLAWASAFTNFSLQQNGSVGNTNSNWANVNNTTYPVITTNGTNTVTLPVSGNQFFRLYQPPSP